MRLILYCDMDGTISDFEGMSHQLFGEPFEPKNPRIPLDKKIEIVQSNRTFWSHMPWMPDGRTLWNYIRQYDPHILSAYSLWDYQNCLSGKRSWIARNTPSVPKNKIHLVHRAEKVQFARSLQKDTVHVLIDDYDKNVREWTSAGGHAIHHRSASESIAALRKLGL